MGRMKELLDQRLEESKYDLLLCVKNLLISVQKDIINYDDVDWEGIDQAKQLVKEIES